MKPANQLSTMGKFLAISNDLIFSTQSGKEVPQPVFGILWAYFPKAQCRKPKLLNVKSVWVGFYIEKLAHFSEKKLAILFAPETAVVSDYLQKLQNFSSLELPRSYLTSSKHCEVVLKFPCREDVILPGPAPVPCNNFINRKVYVDVKFGNDETGQIESYCYPFK